MKPVFSVFALLFLSSLSESVSAQPDADALGRAMLTLAKLDSLLSKNANDTLSAALRQDMDQAVIVFHRNGKRYEEASTRFFRANVEESRWQPDSMLADLQRADTLLLNLEGDSIDLMLMRGHIWNALNAYHANFNFDFYKASQAQKRSSNYYEKAGRDDLVALSLGNYAFTLASFGHGSMALAMATECELKFDQLNSTVKAKSDLTPEYIHYLKGNAYYILSDSLLFAGETAGMQHYAENAIRELDSILPGARVDLARLANTWFLKGYAYYRLPGGLDSAWYYMDKATGIFAFAGANPRSPYGLGQVLKGAILLRKDSIEQGQALLTSGLKDLGYTVGDFFSTERSTAPVTLYQIQALTMKINAMELVRPKHPDRKWLEQTVFDTEVLAGMMEAIKDNYKDRASLERLSDRLSYFYAWGVTAARDLAAQGGPEANRWKERGLRLSELGKGYALRFQLAKRIAPGSSRPGNGSALIEGTDISLASIQANLLDASTVAIEYSLGLRSATAIVVTQDRVEMVALPVLADWKHDLEQADTLLPKIEPDVFEETSARLYQTLLAPLRPYIPAGTRHLVIVPDNYLWRLNFDALVTGKKSDGKYPYLIDSFAISQSYSLQIANWMAKSTANTSAEGRLLGMYIGEFPEQPKQKAKTSPVELSFSDIPEIKEAATKIFNQWTPLAKLNEHPQVLDFNNGLNQYKLVFVGTHGVSDSTILPEEYFFTFSNQSNNRIQVRDIYALAGTRVRTQLLFLASCLTAYGGPVILGEGLPSISRAFHYAGIPTLITTAIKIPPEPTARISELFFEQIKQGNVSVAEALQKAKLAYLKQNGGRLHPFFWAPLICLGYGNLKP